MTIHKVTKGNFRMVIWMEKVAIHGVMVANIKVTLKMDKNMEKVVIKQIMVVLYSKAFGKTGREMGKEHSVKEINFSKEFGKMIILFSNEYTDLLFIDIFINFKLF